MNLVDRHPDLERTTIGQVPEGMTFITGTCPCLYRRLGVMSWHERLVSKRASEEDWYYTHLEKRCDFHRGIHGFASQMAGWAAYIDPFAKALKDSFDEARELAVPVPR